MSDIESTNPAAAAVVKELSNGTPGEDILTNPEAYRPQSAGQQNAPVTRKQRKAKKPAPAGLDVTDPAIAALLARIDALEAANKPMDEPEVEVFGSVLPGEEKVLEQLLNQNGQEKLFKILRREN